MNAHMTKITDVNELKDLGNLHSVFERPNIKEVFRVAPGVIIGRMSGKPVTHVIALENGDLHIRYNDHYIEYNMASDRFASSYTIVLGS